MKIPCYDGICGSAGGNSPVHPWQSHCKWTNPFLDMRCIPCSAYACRWCTGTLPCSTFPPGNIPNNTFHTVPQPCSGEGAMVICTADSSAAHNYPPAPALAASLTTPSSSPLHPSNHSGRFSTRTTLACPESSLDALPSASALPDPSDIGCAPFPSRRCPCPKNLHSGVCCLMSILYICRHYQLPCRRAKRSTSATKCADGSSPSDCNLLPHHSFCQLSWMYCSSPASALGMELPSSSSPDSHFCPFSFCTRPVGQPQADTQG